MILVYVVVIAFATLAGRYLQLAAFASSGVQREEKLKDPQFIAEGAKLFAPSCGNAYCHGTGGVGGGAPRVLGKGLDSAYLFKTISNGIPGTGMLSFESELSEEKIWKLVAFIMSDPKTGTAKSDAPVADKPASPSLPVVAKSPDAIAGLSMAGDVRAGKALFFDSAQAKSCHSCHSFAGEGTPIAPDLSKLGTRSARELFLNVILPNENKDSRYWTISLTLRNGDKIIGVKKEEDAESIRVYDTTELPAVLRTVQKAHVAKAESSSDSVMPKDYAATYTMKQLLDLVTFLKSSDPKTKAGVTLKDLF
ncbi:MAG: c-type cytochrome [Acidobacteriota bacterium]